jgi:hypothetical protein
MSRLSAAGQALVGEHGRPLGWIIQQAHRGVGNGTVRFHES